MKNSYLLLLLALGGVLAFSLSASGERPNIVIIVGDDIGFSDIGAYGAEINTPNLDRLASQGMRFADFNNLSKCDPTRSAIMTGLYREGSGAVGFPQLLRDAGYRTFFAGKEHLMRWVPERVYAKNSFDRWFLSPFSPFMLRDDGGFPQYDRGDKRAIFEVDGEELDVLELQTSKPFHKTDATTDYVLRFLRERDDSDQPFFLYLAYHAAHFPLQATPEDIAIYRDVYRAGWDVIREQRFQKQLDLGVLKEGAVLSSPSNNINIARQPPAVDNYVTERIKASYYRPWNALSIEEKDAYSLEMAVFAAMVERMDRNIGRLLKYLEDSGEAENTLVLFFSDNGACPYDFNRDMAMPPGPAEGYRSLSAPWAALGNTPYRYFKQFGHQGGMQTHCIASWPGVIDRGRIEDSPFSVVDLAPTLMELAGAEYPESVDGVPTSPLAGVSMKSAFLGEPSPEREYLFGGYKGFYSFRKGNLKIVQTNGDTDNWELYDLAEDPSEVRNLAPHDPEVVAELRDAMRKVVE
ncbi:arylsulfatase [Pelagicoccus mobilis]|uniref:Sulfatase-like hydrolase/transferase n=1 Tax=Pelagicoccus mobilis TaxID=415221 RepID=A0A934RUS4_9BACT|nr:arylsulfatase [Pelagicoccus mobilis]MBK1877217.1 sulfatase-like hydrolase/transferase [Pelagicoccus mobilis]